MMGYIDIVPNIKHVRKSKEVEDKGSTSVTMCTGCPIPVVSNLFFPSEWTMLTTNHRPKHPTYLVAGDCLHWYIPWLWLMMWSTLAAKTRLKMCRDTYLIWELKETAQTLTNNWTMDIYFFLNKSGLASLSSRMTRFLSFSPLATKNRYIIPTWEETYWSRCCFQDML